MDKFQKIITLFCWITSVTALAGIVNFAFGENAAFVAVFVYIVGSTIIVFND